MHYCQQHAELVSREAAVAAEPAAFTGPAAFESPSLAAAALVLMLVPGYHQNTPKWVHTASPDNHVMNSHGLGAVVHERILTRFAVISLTNLVLSDPRS